MDTTMIKNILGAYGPSGREDKAAEAIKRIARPMRTRYTAIPWATL